MPEKKNEPCSVCGEYYVYTSQHERNVHGIYLSSPKRRKPAKNKRKMSTELVKVEVVQPPENTIRRVPNVEVVTDGKKIGIVEWIR